MEFLTYISMSIRLLSLVIYTGGYIAYTFVLYPKLSLIPPVQQATLMVPLTRRFLHMTWFTIVAMSAAGVVSAAERQMLSFDPNFLLGTTLGLEMATEYLVSLLMIISAAFMHFFLVPRLNRFSVSVSVSPNDDRFKWRSLLAEGSPLRIMRSMLIAGGISFAFGIILVLLGLAIAFEIR